MKKLIVLIIIVVLISFVGFIFITGYYTKQKINTVNNFQNNTKDQEIKSDISKIQSALELYRVDNGKYPTSLSDLVPKYVNEVKLNPYTNKPYEYVVGENTYTISTELGNGSKYAQNSP